MHRTGRLNAGDLPSRHMGANLVVFAASTLVDAGSPGPVLAQGRDWLAWVQSAGLHDHAGQLRLHLTEAAMETGALEDAARWLDEYEKTAPSAQADPVFTRLRGVLDDLLRAVDQPDQPAPSLQEIVDKTLAVVHPEVALIVGLIAKGPDPSHPEDAPKFRAALMSAGFPAEIAGFAEAVAALDQLSSSGTPRFTINSVFGFLQRSIVALPREGAPRVYEALANLAIWTYQLARERGMWDSALTLGWLATICQRRRGDLAGAASLLGDLRADVRERQLGIADPRLRAALAVRLPHLIPVSVEVAFTRGDAAQLFDVAEAGRARVLLDVMESRARRPLALKLGDFQSFLRRHEERVAYCSFLVDDDDAPGARAPFNRPYDTVLQALRPLATGGRR
jgi:hypothetical protein